MFKKPKKAIITLETKGQIKQASGQVTGEPLPVQLSEPMTIDRLTIVQTGKAVVVTAGNDNEIINIEVR